MCRRPCGRPSGRPGVPGARRPSPSGRRAVARVGGRTRVGHRGRHRRRRTRSTSSPPTCSQAARPTRCSSRSENGWRIDLTHPLARRGRRARGLWGDLDNDGLHRRRARARRRRLESGGRRPRASGATSRSRAAPPRRTSTAWTARSSTPTTTAISTSGSSNAGGPNELLNNNGNGTFRRSRAQAGAAGDGRGSVGVAVADLDHDRDHDLVVLECRAAARGVPQRSCVDATGAPRDSRRSRAAAFDAVRRPPTRRRRPGRALHDGPARPGTMAARCRGRVAARARWPPPWPGAPRAARRGRHRRRRRARARRHAGAGLGGVRRDRRGHGRGQCRRFDAGAGRERLDVAHLGPARGPSVIGASVQGLVDWQPGPGRPRVRRARVHGPRVASDQRRSNASGIGTRARGARGIALDGVRHGAHQRPVPARACSPSRSASAAPRAPTSSRSIWSDGVLQTEIALDAGRLHVIEETQRQLSSCPVLFAFDGTRFALRHRHPRRRRHRLPRAARASTAPPHPRENVLLPDGLLAPQRRPLRAGHRRADGGGGVSRPRRARRLRPAARLADGARRAQGDRRSGADGRADLLPARSGSRRAVTNDRGEDVTARSADADLQRRAARRASIRASSAGPRAHTLDARVRRRRSTAGRAAPVLVVDGWVEYPYAQTMFAAWQAGAPYRAPTLEAPRRRRALARACAREFGYPAGMPRRMTLPLAALPRGTTRAALTHDAGDLLGPVGGRLRRAGAGGRDARAAARRRARCATAGLRRVARPGRSGTPHYDYDAPRAAAGTRVTRAGGTRASAPSTPLVATRDDAVAIFGPGEEVQLEFDAPLTRRCPPDGRAASCSTPRAGARTWTSTPRTARRWRRCRVPTTPARRAPARGVQHPLRGRTMTRPTARATP